MEPPVAKKERFNFVRANNKSCNLRVKKSSRMREIFTKGLVQGVHFILTRHDTVINIRKLLLLPLALQPTVGFGLSNKVLLFFPICHQLCIFSPPALEDLFHVATVISVHLVFFRPSSFDLSSFFLCSTFVTISFFFLLGGVVSPTPNPQPGGLGHHLWPVWHGRPYQQHKLPPA